MENRQIYHEVRKTGWMGGREVTIHNLEPVFTDPAEQRTQRRMIASCLYDIFSTQV